MNTSTNPLLSDRDVQFLLHELIDLDALLELEPFAEHSQSDFDLYLSSVRSYAREVLFPLYKPFDEQPPIFRDGQVFVHPRLRELYPQMVELGLLTGSRPLHVGGQQLPLTVAGLANMYVMAANLSAYAYIGLTAGAGHLIESFASETVKALFMERMYEGRWTGTMALTEPQAGSSLSDVATKAVPETDGTYRIKGAKIFISGGDHDIAENIVHLTLARIEGAPPGTKGISLFAVPKLRPEHGRLVPNDVHTSGCVHKIGWRAVPSVILSLGEQDDCHGWLIGQPNRGLAYMFQMMNEARLMVGMNGAATASVAYHESLNYALSRQQGRPLKGRDLSAPQVPIVAHADVRRMLLRQKAIVEGARALLTVASFHADLAEHAPTQDVRQRSFLLLDLLTPVAKSFPAEWGFESTALAVQVHGGYGYSSEYLPEALLRDQKLNSLHEGTTGMQSIDLLGRKVLGDGGVGLRILAEEIETTMARAHATGIERSWIAHLEHSLHAAITLSDWLRNTDDKERALRHSADYLQLFSLLVIGWQWLLQAAIAKEALTRGSTETAFYEGKLCAAQYWLATELPRVHPLIDLIRGEEDSYVRMQPEWF